MVKAFPLVNLALRTYGTTNFVLVNWAKSCTQGIQIKKEKKKRGILACNT
jgi:hypothetical protein